MEIQQIDPKIAASFIKKWHYSGRCPRGKNIYFGWFMGECLYAVADYGIGINPYQAQSLSAMTGHNIQIDSLLELKRLCRVEPKIEKYPLTQFLSKCHKLLKQMGYCYVVSFSDPTFGHSGGIYKASNFTHLGQTNAEYHAVDKDGTVRHRRYYYRYARSKGINMEQARDELGLELVRTLPKDRWFIQIGK